jgi:hypothetical protein
MGGVQPLLSPHLRLAETARPCLHRRLDSHAGKLLRDGLPVKIQPQPPELLLATDASPYPHSWTPDGKTLLYTQSTGGKGRI